MAIDCTTQRNRPRLQPGDLAVREPNGSIRIIGRIRDMVIRGGENVYPREIEEILFAHPTIESAQSSGSRTSG